MRGDEITLKDCYPDGLYAPTDIFGIANCKIPANALADVCQKLHFDLGFNYLADITAIDCQDRIEVVYQLTNLSSNEKIALRVDLDHETPVIDSVVSIWKGADFQEREVYDLMGVVFSGHPNLTRILLPSDWEGYPLRKDYVIPD